MDGLLHTRVYLDHLLVQFWVIVDHGSRVECRSNKDGVNSARNWRDKDLADLQPDNESKCDDDGSELAVAIVARRCEYQVQVCEESASISHKSGAHGQHRTDQAFVDEGVDAAVFDQASEKVN